MSFRLIRLLILTLFLFGCATAGRKQVSKIRTLVKTGEYESALKIVKSKDYYPDEESRLLKYIEAGTIHHLNGHYYQSLKDFDKAKELSDKLFTVSISKKIKSAVSNDSADNYYGEVYERSFIRFYQSLNHLLLSFKGEYEAHEVKEGKNVKKIEKKTLNPKEKRTHLQSSRAVILEWDSLLDSYRKEKTGVSVYKNDLTLKLYGALIHELMGSRSEKNIARQLYKDAKAVLLKNYNIYPSYNARNEKFKKDFKKLHKLSKKKLELDYIAKTHLASELNTYLDKQIKRLKKNKPSNISILIEEGFISPKKGKKIEFPIGFNTLPFGVNNKRDFITFVRKAMAISAGANPTVSYELPHIQPSKVDQKLSLVVKTKEGEVKTTQELILANPLSEVAHEALDAQMGAIKTKVGLRVAAKHLAALTTAYLAYRKAAKSGQADFLAALVGTGMYALANKGIKESELADLRHWSTLPRNIRLGHFNLSKGDYDLFLKVPGAQAERKLGSFSVEDNKKKKFLKYRIF